MPQNKPKDYSYIINELGEKDLSPFNSVSPPLFQSSNFSFPTVEALRSGLANEMESSIYTRGINPTTAVLRKKLAALAGAEDALIFSSGTAAVAASVLSFLKEGDHALCIKKPYSWTNALFGQMLPDLGFDTDFYEGAVPADIESLVKPNTKLIFLESPNSFTFEMQDLKAFGRWAKERGIITMIDNSFSTPIGQRAIELGIDIEIHSASKYLGGHSDLVAGVVIGSAEHCRKIFERGFMNLGAAQSPNDSWLMIRSLRTLDIRMNKIENSAGRVSEFLENHPRVRSLNCALYPSHPQYDLAQKQMSFGGGLFSFKIDTDDPIKAEAFCNSLKRFRLAVSWGGHESLIIPSIALRPRDSQGIDQMPVNLIRMYIGLEEPQDLIDDIEQALSHI